MSVEAGGERSAWNRIFLAIGRFASASLLLLVSCAPPADDRGRVLWEYWVGIGGNAIGDLTNHPDYPDHPSGRRLLNRLETPREFENDYGARLRGFLHPPVTGEYRFRLSSGGDAELWLGENDRPGDKTRLAVVTAGRTGRRQSRSEGIELEAGKRYYVELLHKESGRGDYLRVDWWLPGLTEPRVVTGASLSPLPVEEVDAIRFSVEDAFPDEPFALHLATSTREAIIYYTTDGSWPSPARGELYRGPIDVGHTVVVRALAVKEGAIPTEVATRTYIFLEDVVHQEDVAPRGSHWNTRMDPEVVNSPIYRDRVLDALLAIPSISLATSGDDMFGRDGIYRNSTKKGRSWERPVSVELFQPDGRREFSIHGGVRITGGRSRVPRATPKHSFRVAFRRKYGQGNLSHRLFPDSDSDRYDGFILRAGFNHSWTTRTGDSNYAQYLRNAFTRDAQNATGSFNGAGRFGHLYVNGLYWGLYFMEDRQDAAFAAAVFGGDEDDYDVIQDREPEHGDLEAFDAMFEIANRGLETAEDLEELVNYLDLEHFIDYVIVHNFLANYDWPGRNWRAVRKREPGAQFRFFTWDAEWTLPHYRPVWTEAGDYESGLTTGSRDRTPGRLFQKLRDNEEFRLRFADRLHRHFYAEDGAFNFSQNRASLRYRDWADRIDEAIIAESARWGGTRRTPPFTRDDAWLPERDRIANDWLLSRPAAFLEQCRRENLYPWVEAPTFNRSGGSVDHRFELRVDRPAGKVYFTIDGSDPRRPFEGAISPWAREYDGTPIRFRVTTRLKARAVVNGEWSALNEAVFYVRQDWSALRITEIMYHPRENPFLLDEGLLEFIELQNASDATIDVSGLTFTDGIGFTFPAGSVLNPGAVVVVAADRESFVGVYGVEPFGVYRGRLDNGGERIRMADPEGKVLIDLEYDDGNGWPVLADGGGPSLVSRGSTGGLDPRLEWSTSRGDGGSPGAHP
jgi:hypothetical protein